MSIGTGIDYHHVGMVQRDRKKGHSCCGGCCDMRRAVIVASFILLIGRTLTIMGIHQLSNFARNFSQGSVDDVSEADAITNETNADVFENEIFFFDDGLDIWNFMRRFVDVWCHRVQ